MKRIGIIGYGALGKQIENFLIEAFGNLLLEACYFDDHYHQQGGKNAYPFEAYQDSRFQDLDFYIGLGYKHLIIRKQICDRVLNSGARLPSFVHRTTYVHPSAKVGNGVYFYPMSTIDQEVEIKNGTLVNNAVTISHNTTIDACSFIAPGVTIAGNVTIGKYCFVGAGTVIANNVSVGDNAKVGLASAVTKDVIEGTCVIGNPMKVLEKPFILT